ncbi:MAG: hypothetical protein H6603_02075 [Flavobacteriales bacterium]|nr:hypothetical protein [Flavobacteriales bacterium]MCB9203739.1 hypothetical protein [Flavobacteriales bacterium]
MKLYVPFLATLILIAGLQINAQAQQDSTAFDSKFGASLNYTGVSLIESAVIELQFKYTMKRHAISLGPHIAYHDLFGGQSDWERYGVSLTYEYFPIRSNRLFSPFLFYDLDYAYSKSRREVTVPTSDGIGTYAAAREVTMNGLSHHFGIGTRCNFYKGLFLHLSAGAGPATYGNSVYLRPLHSSESDVRELESPFANYQTVFTFRIGLAYQIGLSKLKKGNPQNCCD